MNTTLKKVINISFKVITWIMAAVAVFMMIFTIISVTTVDKNDRSLFGIKLYIVQSDSMSLSENNADLNVHFDAGDIVLIKDLDDNERSALKAGDIIAFLSMNTYSKGQTVTHMVREVRTTDDGNVVGYVTYGTNTGVDDETLVEPGFVLGKYTGKLPNVGHFFQFMKSTPGYIICILIPFLILILYNILNIIRLFRIYAKEQMQKMQAEREEIERNRAENQRMMTELLELRAQLAQNGYQTPIDDTAEEKIQSDTAEDETVEGETAEGKTDKAQ